VATKAEKIHMDKVASLGCYCCQRPAALHHIRNNGKGNVGMGRRSSHYEVIPLCPDHHQGKFSIHMSKKSFEEKFGTEKEILDNVLERLKQLECRSSIL
tara:strand:+ start:1178 stop:1474 length:297 start_codon:yes stop_codon:yes gene_type:complete